MVFAKQVSLRCVALFLATLLLMPQLSRASASETVISTNNEAAPNWQRAIAELVQQHLPATATQHRIELLTPTATLQPLERCANLAARFTREPDRLAGRTMVTLSCQGHIRDNPRFAQIHVAVTGNYLVVTRDLPAQHTLVRNDLGIEEGDLERLPRHALLATPNAIAEATGQQLRRALSQHSILQANLLSRPQVVSFGDELVIAAQGKGFQITRTGEAMDTGAIGDIIRVRLNNKQLIRVEIVGPGRAKPAQ